MIGMLQWIVELGIEDLAMEVSAIYLMMSLPREDQLAPVLQFFSFLKSERNGVAALDPTELGID